MKSFVTLGEWLDDGRVVVLYKMQERLVTIVSEPNQIVNRFTWWRKEENGDIEPTLVDEHNVPIIAMFKSKFRLYQHPSKEESET